MAIRVLIVDDHPVVREGLVAFLELHDDIELVASVGTVAAALDTARHQQPDIVLLDLQLPDGHGLGAIPDLIGVDEPPKVVVLTSFLDPDLVRQAIRLGAAGYLAKHSGPDVLLEGIRSAAAGGMPLDPEAARALAAAPRHDPLDDLTAREREVLAHLARGENNRTIAAELFITEKTVKTHVSAILAKLGVDDRTQAAVFAKDRGM